MKFEYRKIIKSFELTKEEAETLYLAEEILTEMNNKLSNVDGTEIENRLKEAVSDALNYLEECNCKLSIRSTLGMD